MREIDKICTPNVIKSLEDLRDKVETAEQLNDNEYYRVSIRMLNTYIDALADTHERNIAYELSRQYDKWNNMLITLKVYVEDSPEEVIN